MKKSSCKCVKVWNKLISYLNPTVGFSKEVMVIVWRKKKDGGMLMTYVPGNLV